MKTISARTGLALAALSLLAAPAASAQTISADPAPVSDRTASVTVTALANEATIPSAVSGARFELVRVEGVDVSDPEDWEQVRDAFEDGTTDQFYDQLSAEKIELGPTPASGRLDPVTVPQGLYLLHQVASEATDVKFKDAFFTAPTLDFDSSWSYDLQVYPKGDCGCKPGTEPTPEPSEEPTPTPSESQTPTPEPSESTPAPQPSASQSTTPAPVPTAGDSTPVADVTKPGYPVPTDEKPTDVTAKTGGEVIQDYVADPDNLPVLIAALLSVVAATGLGVWWMGHRARRTEV